MRRRGLRPLAPALERVAEAVAPASLLGRAQRAWTGAAGERIADESEPVSERAGEVTVACSSSVWANELSLLSDDLLARLNETLAAPGSPPAVRALRFVTRPPGPAGVQPGN